MNVAKETNVMMMKMAMIFGRSLFGWYYLFIHPPLKRDVDTAHSELQGYANTFAILPEEAGEETSQGYRRVPLPHTRVIFPINDG